MPAVRTERRRRRTGNAFPLGRRAWLAAAAAVAVPAWARATTSASAAVPVLAYHRFGAGAVDSMTVRLKTFGEHLAVLRELDCSVVPMQDLLDWRAGRAALPPRAVVLTADDAHRSQFEHMAPLLRPLGWDVTLFVYPSAVSNASYAMTWDAVRALHATGHWRIESHTFWHPNFAQERRRLAPAAFERFARDQLERSRERLQREVGVTPTLLAWPFGVSDAQVRQLARGCGYQAAFSLGNRHVGRRDDPFDLPRHLVTEAMSAARLRHVLTSAWA